MPIQNSYTNDIYNDCPEPISVDGELRCSDLLKTVFDESRDAIKRIGKSIEEYATQSYIGFKYKGRQIAWIETHRKSLLARKSAGKALVGWVGSSWPNLLNTMDLLYLNSLVRHNKSTQHLCFLSLLLTNKSFDIGAHIVNEDKRLLETEFTRIETGEEDRSEIFGKVKESYENLGDKPGVENT